MWRYSLKYETDFPQKLKNDFGDRRHICATFVFCFLSFTQNIGNICVIGSLCNNCDFARKERYGYDLRCIVQTIINRHHAETSDLYAKLYHEQQKSDRLMTLNQELGDQIRDLHKELKVRFSYLWHLVW